MPPKYHHQQHQQQKPAHHQQPQQSSTTTPPVIPPSINDFLSTLMRIAASQQGGPFAMHLANHPFANLTEQVHRNLRNQVEGLPVNIPQYLINQNRGARTQLLSSLYQVARLFLEAVIVHSGYVGCSPASCSSPRDRLESMMNAYTAFETLHKEERGTGAANALLPVPGQSASNVGWDTAILVVLCQKIRALAQVEGALDDGLLSDLIRKWRAMFVFLVSSDQGIANNVARRRGALVVLNCLLAVLFHLGNLHQVKALLSSVDQLESTSGGDPNKGVLGPCGHIKSEVTKIIYYQARFKLYAGLDQVSFNLFSQVAERLPPLKSLASSSRQQAASTQSQLALLRNKTRAVFYLCINSMLCGIVPDVNSLLGGVDSLTHSIISPIVHAINCGSPTKLERAVNSPTIAPILQIRSVYLQVKQLYLLTIFVAIKRIHSILSELEQDNSRMDIDCIAKVSKTLDKEALLEDDGKNNSGEEKKATTGEDAALTTNNDDDDDDDLDYGYDESNTMSNMSLVVDIGQMIQLGWLKGYVSFEHQILVLSKKDPFPKRVIVQQ